MGIFGAILGAGAAIFGAKSQEKAAKTQAEAAKAAANTTTQEIKHLSPVETQAMGFEGYQGAQAWWDMQNQAKQSMFNFGAQRFMQPQLLNFGQGALNQTAAIQGVTAGVSRDAEYAAYDMLRKTRTAAVRQIEYLGIDDGTGRNPYGVKIDYDEYLALMRAKDPAQHIAAGSSLSDDPSPGEIQNLLPAIRPREWDEGNSASPAWIARFELLHKMSQDLGLGGETLKAMNADPGWADAITYWKRQGVIDAQDNVNQGQLTAQSDKFTQGLVETRTMEPMTDEKENQWRDLYNQAASKQIDPKFVRIEDLGGGVERTVLLNADGTTPMASFLRGNLTLPGGQTIDNVTFFGQSRQEWAQFQQLASRTEGLFTDAINNTSFEKKPPKEDKAAPQGYQGANLSGGQHTMPDGTMMADADMQTTSKPKKSAKPEGFGQVPSFTEFMETIQANGIDLQGADPRAVYGDVVNQLGGPSGFGGSGGFPAQQAIDPSMMTGMGYPQMSPQIPQQAMYPQMTYQPMMMMSPMDPYMAYNPYGGMGTSGYPPTGYGGAPLSPSPMGIGGGMGIGNIQGEDIFAGNGYLEDVNPFD